MEELKAEEVKYTLNNKVFILQNDFTWKELEWLDYVIKKLQSKGNEVSSSFTEKEMFKTLNIILEDEDGLHFENNDYEKVDVGVQTKILADFFLMKSIQGSIIRSLSIISRAERMMK